MVADGTRRAGRSRRIAAHGCRRIPENYSKQEQVIVSRLFFKFDSMLTRLFSVSYHPITLEYNHDNDGETLKYMDDIVKWKVEEQFYSFEIKSSPPPFRRSCGLSRWRNVLTETASILSLGSLCRVLRNHLLPNRPPTWLNLLQGVAGCTTSAAA